ncbi:MAG: hypothetical protein U1F36_20290 [Planctomycetota bacterium]
MILLRVFARTLVICGGTALVAVLLSLSGLWIVSALTSVGGGFWAMSAGRGWLDESRNGSMVAAFSGLLIVVIAGVMSMVTIEENLWPGTVSGIALAEAPAHPWASVFQFNEGEVRADLAGSVGVYDRHAVKIDETTVAPIVAADWTPDRPVAVWAVARRDTLDARREHWKQPVRAGARVAGFHVSDYLEAIGDARAQHRLRSVLDPVLVDWTPTPQEALAVGWCAFARIVGTASVSMFVTIVLARYLR